MRIDHVAMYVADLEGARTFFEKYFNASAGELYHNRATGFQSYFLSFDSGVRLEIMYRPEVENIEDKTQRMGFVHLAFSVGSREQVDALTKRLAADGYPTISGPRVTGDGYYESCISGVEGNLIKITV